MFLFCPSKTKEKEDIEKKKESRNLGEKIKGKSIQNKELSK